MRTYHFTASYVLANHYESKQWPDHQSSSAAAAVGFAAGLSHHQCAAKHRIRIRNTTIRVKTTPLPLEINPGGGLTVIGCSVTKLTSVRTGTRSEEAAAGSKLTSVYFKMMDTPC